MKKSRKLLTWNESLKLNKRAYALIYKRCPEMIISRIACIAWDALTPYVGIYLSAMLINELAGNRNASVLKNLVLIILCSAAIISLVTAFLHKWRDTECAGLHYRVQQIFSEKMISMDYVDADNAKTHEMYDTIEQNRNGGGWGLNEVYEHVEGIISSVLTLFGGIAMTITLFISQVPASSGRYAALNNPLFIGLIIAVMLAITYISPSLSTKAGSYYALNSNSHNLGNRLFGYFGWLGYENEYAADVRIYRQDLICDKYNNDKNGIFGSKGMFAKLAKGPIGLYNAASSAVAVLFTGVVYTFVCLKALGGAFGIGSATQYIASITKLSESTSSLIRTAGEMRNNASFLKLIFEFLDIPNNMYQGSLTVEKSMLDYEIEFRDVSFRYPGSESYALYHVNMKFRVGERLAVVGQNGSGKTTFIKLLCRLYDPTEGEILLNGINIREYNYTEYMSVFSVVFQDFKLFAFTLGQNVGTKVDYNKNRAENCLKDAGFGERLKELTDGTETYLYKELSKTGVEISGGEAQKIAFARALYKDAPFIVLDEPTAALDPIAEAEVYSNFNNIVGDKTAIYISHRLSSCRFCDDIAVFDDGQIVQQGSHDELVVDENGKYHELWYAQAQYYK
jgi:ATP-binding cassette subfamily B protein